LFELLNDKTRYQKITALYSFSYLDFIGLTGVYDTYSIETQHKQFSEMQTYIDELLKSKEWLESQWKAGQDELVAKETHLLEVLKSKEWLESQWRAGQDELVAKEAHLVAKEAHLLEVLKGKEWLESQWKAGQDELVAKETHLLEVLKGKELVESQLREQSIQLEKLQRAIPVRFMKYIGVI
jgi:heat shock protein HslJ